MVAKAQKKDLLIEGEAPEQDEEPIMVSEGDDNPSLDDQVGDNRNAGPSNKNLDDTADEILGNFLYDNSESLFGNLVVDEAAKDIIKILGPRFLTSRPVLGIQTITNEDYNTARITNRLDNVIPPELGRRILVDKFGEYAKKLDFYQSKDIVSNLSKVSGLVLPEGRFDLSGLSTIYSDKFHIYTLALSMPNEYRSIATLIATKKNEGQLDLIFDLGDTNSIDSAPVKFKEICMPTLSDIVAVAEEYDVASDGNYQVLPLFDAFKETLKTYLDGWKDE